MHDKPLLSGILWRIAVIGALVILIGAVIYALAALLGVLANA